MTVVEDLLLRLRTAGASEAASSVDRVRKSVHEADKSAKSASKSHAELGKAFGGIGKIGAMAVGAAGLGGLTAGIGESIKNAQHFQESQAQLGASIRANVHAPARDATAQMSEFADSLSTRGGFDPGSSIQGMTQFLRATHSITKAESDMTLATNISRGAHVDLGRAQRAVIMLEQGRATGLSKLGIAVKPVTTAVDQLHAIYKKATPEQLAAAKATDALATKQQAMAIVSKQYGGAMAAYSKTSAGGIQNLRNTVEVLSTKFGTLLLPVISKVTGAITKFVDQMLHGTGAGGRVVAVLKQIVGWLGEVWKWIKQNKEIVEDLAIAVGTVIAVYKGWEIATAAVKAAQEALNAVSDMNPWVLAIGAVVVAVILLYKHFKWFRDFAQGVLHAVAAAFDWVQNAASDVVHWVANHWPLLVGILTGPIGLAIVEIVQHFDTLKKIPGEIIGAFKSAGAAIAKAIVWPFSWAFHWVKKHLPHFTMHHVGPISIPLPSFQAGGVMQSTGVALVGEHGPELVTLPRGTHVTSNEALRGVGGEQTIVIYNMLDGKKLSQSIIRQGLLQQSRGG